MKDNQFFTEIPTLETKHYILRGMTIDDSPKLFSFMAHKETMKSITPNPVQTVEEMKEAISKYLTRFVEQKEIPWVIIHKQSGEVIGQFRLHKLNLWHKKAEMGAVIKEDFQRQGVMTEIIQIIIPFVFETIELNRLVGDIFAGNDGSRKLLEKFGFKKEGVLRDTDFDGESFHDTVVYSMLRGEFLDKVTPNLS